MYTFAPAALAKWSRHNLQVLPAREYTAAFRFCYEGSTCRDTGTPFTACFELTLKLTPTPTVTAFKVHVPAPAQGYQQACQPDPVLLRQRLDELDVAGRPLAKLLRTDEDVIPAGCFCTVPMLRHKLLMVAATADYYLRQHTTP